MVLKKQIALLFLLIIFTTKAENLIDKYDNVYRGSQDKNAMLVFCDAFSLLDANAKNETTTFIDSLFNAYEIEHSYPVFQQNAIELKIASLTLSQAKSISQIWQENRKSWLDFLSPLVAESKPTAKDFVLYRIAQQEVKRPYYIKNKCLKSVLHFQLKEKVQRNINLYAHINPIFAENTILPANELVQDSSLANNEIMISFPVKLNRIEDFLILESIVSQNAQHLNTQYNCNTAILHISLQNTNELLSAIDTHLLFISPENWESNKLKTQQTIASKIVPACNSTIFLHNENLNEKLNLLSYAQYKNYLQELFLQMGAIVRVKQNQLHYKSNTLVPFSLENLSDSIWFKSNSTRLVHAKDSLKIQQMNSFLLLNTNYKVNIMAYAKGNEYLQIPADKKRAIFKKYKDYSYKKSRQQNLSLFRALSVLEQFSFEQNILKRSYCTGLIGKGSFLYFKVEKE